MMSWARRNWDVALILLIAAALYQPWDTPHLPLTDFGLFFGARGGSPSPLAQYANVAGYYISEGRLCLISYLYLVTGSIAFGTWAPGWHWMYFVLNACVLILAQRLLSRMGVGRAATFVALALWATMGPTAELWLRPAGEPIALIFFLTAAHLALGYSDAGDWKRRAVLIALCTIGIAFSKEVLLALLPAGWLISRLRLLEGELRWTQWSQRDTYLLKLVGACVAISIVPIAYVAMHASETSYVAQYSTASSRWEVFVRRLEVVLVPSSPRLHLLKRLANDPAWSLIRILPSLAWIGLAAIAVTSKKRRTIKWPIVVGAAWIGAGLVAYVPWPSQAMFYMMPFALGTMFAAAHLLDGPLSKGSRDRRAAIALCTVMIFASAVDARGILQQGRLRAALNRGVIRAISAEGRADVLIGAVRSPLSGTGGWAHHLRGFALAENGTVITRWADMPCAEAEKALRSVPGAVVVSAGGGCGQLADGSLVISSSVHQRVWPAVWRQTISAGKMYVARTPPSHAQTAAGTFQAPSTRTPLQGTTKLAVRPVEASL